MELRSYLYATYATCSPNLRHKESSSLAHVSNMIESVCQTEIQIQIERRRKTEMDTHTLMQRLMMQLNIIEDSPKAQRTALVPLFPHFHAL